MRSWSVGQAARAEQGCAQGLVCAHECLSKAVCLAAGVWSSELADGAEPSGRMRSEHLAALHLSACATSTACLQDLGSADRHSGEQAKESKKPLLHAEAAEKEQPRWCLRPAARRGLGC